jgi:hypothetical protein
VSKITSRHSLSTRRNYVSAAPRNARLLAATLLAASMLAASVLPSAAWYRHGYYDYRYYDPGPAIALGIFGAMAGAMIASQAPVYSPYPYPYYMLNSSYDPYSFGPAGCAPGFYWNGQECWPY